MEAVSNDHDSSGMSLLMTLLSQLRLPEQSIGLALLYFHRYNKWQISQKSAVLDVESLSLSVISVAAKASEKPRRLREILVPAYSYLHPSKTALTIPSAKYDELRSSLVNAELILLRVLKFELRLSTPFDYLEDLLRDYISYCKSDRAHYDDYTMVLDSMIGVVSRCNIHKAMMKSSIATLYTAKTIAVSSMLVAAKDLDIHPLGCQSASQWDYWLKDVARESPEDVNECIADLQSTGHR